MENRETFDEAVCILFAAHKLAMEHGYYFHEDPRTLADLVDRSYKRYTDLDIDMKMADDYMLTLASATNAIPIVRDAVTKVRKYLA